MTSPSMSSLTSLKESTFLENFAAFPTGWK